VDAPEIVDALVNVAVVVVLASDGGSDQPEKDILNFQLEHRYKMKIDSLLEE